MFQMPNQGQSGSGENNPQNNSQGSNVLGGNGPSQIPGQVPRAIRVSFRTGGPQGFVFVPRPPPPPPQPSTNQPQPQPNGGLGAMFTNLLRPFMQPQRNPEGASSSQNEQQPGNQPSSSGTQQAGENMNPFLNILFQNVNPQQQQTSQQGDGQNVNRDQPGQSGENQQQPVGGNVPLNFGQMFNTVFQFMNPRNQQGDGQNVNQEGQQPGAENQQQQQQPAGANIPQHIAPILQMLQTIVNTTQQQAGERQNVNPNQGQQQQQPDAGLNFLEDIFQIFGDLPGPPGDNTNQQEGGRNERPAGGINWMQIIQNLLPQGTEIRFQFNGVDVNNDPNIENLLNQLFNGAMEQRVRGISEQDLRRLPMTKVSQKHVDNEVQCVTCMESFKLDEDVAELGCKHIFHKACLIPWLQTRRTCPVCRAQVDPATWPSAPPEEEEHHPNSNNFTDMDELD